VHRALIVKQDGFILEIAKTLADAKQKIQAQSFNVIVSDMNLPDGSGLEIFQELRQLLPETPIILLTGALKDEAIALEAMQQGAQDYLLKGSIDTITLVRSIKYSIERKRLLLIRDEFVNIVSHELRTPLAILRESLAMIVDGTVGSISDEQRELLSISLNSTHRLLRTTNKLLDIAKMESGKIALKKYTFDIISVAKEIKKTAALFAKIKGLPISGQFPDSVLAVVGDRDLIIQVFTNLISNAVKFTDNGNISLSVEQKDEHVECCVSDTGPGISNDDLPKLFSKFEQFGKKDAERKKGTGLGLAICKNIIEAHGGKIWVESELN